MISFKWRHFKQNVILMLVRWYLAYSLSYRDIEELAAERGLTVDHSSVNRWVIKYAPLLAESFRRSYKKPVGSSWSCDETYVKIKGNWHYLYRAVDKSGDTVDFYLSKQRNKQAALTFFKKAIKTTHSIPNKIIIDKSGANKSALNDIKLYLILFYLITGSFIFLDIKQIKYLNNIIEQDHRFIKRLIRPMMGFKDFLSAKATLVGIELHHMLRKGQHINYTNLSVHEQFFSLAG